MSESERHLCQYLLRANPDTGKRHLCGNGGRRYVVMGHTSELEMPLCARHREILARHLALYTVEAFRALKPRHNPPKSKTVELKLK